MKHKPKITQYLLLLIIFFSYLHPFKLTAQTISIDWPGSSVVKENVSPDSISNEKKLYFYFDGASYPDNQSLLPHFYQIIEQGLVDAESIKLINPQFDTLDYNSVNNVSGIEQLDTSLTITAERIYLQKKPKVAYSFVPVLKKGSHILLVKSFQLEFEWQAATSFQTKKSEQVKMKKSSVLSSGTWKKIRLQETGIYKLTYEDLSELGIGNPSQVRIYGNVGGQLPFNTDDERVQGLQENPIYMHTGTDGSFGSGDYILFYGMGPNRWNYNTFHNMYVHDVNDYSDYAYYFLTSDLGAGKRIEKAEEVMAQPEVTYNDYVYVDYHEQNDKNLFKSGRQWFELLPNHQKEIEFTIPDVESSRPAKILTRVVGRSGSSTSFSIYHGNSKLSDVSISGVNLNSHETTYARAGSVLKSVSPSASGSIPVKIVYNRRSSQDKGWLDYVMVNGYRQLKLANEPMFFRQWPSDEPTVAKFSLSGATNKTLLWDVSNPHEVKQITTHSSGSNHEFKALIHQTNEFVAFNLSHTFLKPDLLDEEVPNQDLFEMDPVNYIIVAHPEFLDQANELAELHRNKSKLSVAVVTPQQIYNDFSSGAPDVSAMRDFFKWMYDKDNASNPVFRYVLLFGDGTFDNKGVYKSKNFILTYQSNESLHQVNSFVGDDFFTFLDPGEGDGGGTMDIGIGRLPVHTKVQAGDMLDKIKTYMDDKTMGSWRNRLCFVGDDEDSNQHMKQANDLTNKIISRNPQFQIQKVYLDAYKQQVSANGTTYPEVEKTVFDELEKGVLLFNYTGHGSENGLTHERIILKNDIQNWTNAPHFPLFITATCEFSRFDNNEKTTAGEYVLLNPDGGGIALLTTTRLVYSLQNYYLNSSFYDYAFKLNENNEKYRFGDILRLSKNARPNEKNKRNFTLLGDPALSLNYPLFRVYTDSINNISVKDRADTISAFSEVTISGHVGDYEGNVISGFNGSVYPVILDKEQEITTFNNDNEKVGPFTFHSRNNIIYKGKASVNDGRFSFKFLVPKDIGYTIGQGKILYYAENQSIDAHGYDTALYIGGEAKDMIVDNHGPEIELYLNDSNFVEGGISDANPRLFAVVEDESGINATGSGIGHDIVAYLNGNTKEIFVLNEYYETLQDNYTSGTVNYPLQNLEPGWHTLTLKVWDIINNSSEKTIEFQVLDGSEPVIENVYNYPNPVTSSTHFNVEHNLGGQDLNVVIEIYDLSGRLMKRIEENIFSEGYRLPPLQWEGTNNQGGRLDSGIYPYRVTIRTENGISLQKFSKLILR